MPTPERDELEAAIQARRELGEELEPQLVDGFVERIERRIDERARELMSARRPARRRPDWSAFALAILSLGVAVPIVEKTSFAGQLVMWIAIVAVNLAYNFRRAG
jgi:hypothetical protein